VAFHYPSVCSCYSLNHTRALGLIEVCASSPWSQFTWLAAFGATETLQGKSASFAFCQRAAACVNGIAMHTVIGYLTAQPEAMYSLPCRLPQAEKFRKAVEHLYDVLRPMSLAPLTPKTVSYFHQLVHDQPASSQLRPLPPLQT